MLRGLMLLVLVLILSGCSQGDVELEVNPLSEGAYCLPYTPEGQVIYDSEWTGKYPEMDQNLEAYKTVTFGMGCFWGPGAKFAVVEGVLRTRVGYAGGTLLKPTYETLGDHIEVIEVDYDPELISFEEVVEKYFEFYDARARPYSLRVNSVIYYRDERERVIAEKVKRAMESELGRGLFTEINPMDVFYLGEERHQLSYLKQELSLFEEIKDIYPKQDQLLLSVLASKLNGYIAGYGRVQELDSLLGQSGLSEASMNRVLEIRED